MDIIPLSFPILILLVNIFPQQKYKSHRLTGVQCMWSEFPSVNYEKTSPKRKEIGNKTSANMKQISQLDKNKYLHWWKRELLGKLNYMKEIFLFLV